MSTKTILLVEDEAIIALAEAASIKRFGYDVVPAYSGEDAVKAAAEDATISLILMDIDLGKGIDGTEAARRILLGRNLPIVFLTSHSEREMVEKVRGITRYGYVIKNSGDFVLQSSIEMAFELFEALEKTKEKEKALQKSEILYRSVVTAMAEGVVFQTADGEVTATNPAALRIDGRLAEKEQAGISDQGRWTTIREDGSPFPDADHPAMVALRTGEPQLNVVLGLQGTDGTLTWISINAQPLVVPGESKPCSVVTTFRDITEQKEAEAALAQEQYLLQALMNNSPDYIYFKDRASRFVRASKALAQSFGLSDPGQLIGKTDFDFFTEEHARQAFEDEQAIVRTGRALSKEEKETRGDRSDAWVLSVKLPLCDKTGNIVGTFGISRDITERKLAEERAEYHTRLYATLSRINRTIIHVKHKEELFDRVCEIVVATGKFRMAWIGLMSEGGDRIDRVAHAGKDDDYKPQEGDMQSGLLLSKSPVGTAIRTGKVVLYEDLTDPGRKDSHGIDFRSSAAIPLRFNGGVGILNIYATEIGFFSQEERSLLEEIGLDISFALDKMELEKERDGRTRPSADESV
jgi:PAS domain S-box-containing protein